MSARKMAQRVAPLTVFTMLAGGVGSALGAPINDAAYFDSLDTTIIDFETDGSGAAVDLIQGEVATLPANEYAGAGVRFGGDVAWANDGNVQMDAAQLLGASPTNSMPSSLINAFTMHFDVPVEAFGFFVANNKIADPSGPSFTAYDADGMVIESVNWGASFIDAGFSLVDYGFMGISSPGTAIARVEVTKQAAILDDLTFAVVPAPGAAGLLAGAGAMALRRRRR